ncbi:MAG: L,D-transpeptidase family protein [Blautia sp.]|nr:L,D-transpeptidase family protein [Clostridia bacterium]MDY4693331.1 L,D-transpeptidase family protein [Blautia sp.]MDY5554294.1 L,D-transpeptidase family protein [Blautia sp.]
MSNLIWQKLLEKFAGDPSVRQLIFVKCTSGSNADFIMYTKGNGNWKELLSCPAFIGKKGLGKEKEGDMKTPEGIYNLPIAFGIKDNPGTKIPYTKVNENLYWCGDDNYYNQLIDISQRPHKCLGEHLIECVPHYNYAMFIDYNKQDIFGKGSAIFLHCMGEKPYTAGCVAISEENMKAVLTHAGEGMKICIYPA